MIKNELYRLINGIEATEKTNSMEYVEFKIKCRSNSFDVLSKCKEVLKIVLCNNENAELTIDEWKKLLPLWFIEKCAKELSKEEAEERLNLTIEERRLIAKNESWTLSDWIYWFKPQERQWYWWDAKIVDFNTIHLVLECYGWPFAWGALRWLWKVCGAFECEED